MTDPKIRKKEKNDRKTSVKKNKPKRDGSEYICTCVSNTWLKFQSEKCNFSIERSMTDIALFLVITRLMYGIVFFI